MSRYVFLVVVAVVAAAAVLMTGSGNTIDVMTDPVDNPFIDDSVEQLAVPKAVMRVCVVDVHGSCVSTFVAPIGSVVFSGVEVRGINVSVEIANRPDVSAVNGWGFRITVNVNETVYRDGAVLCSIPISKTWFLSSDNRSVSMYIDLSDLGKCVSSGSANANVTVYAYVCVVSGSRDVVCSYTKHPITINLVVTNSSTKLSGHSTDGSVEPPQVSEPTPEPEEPPIERWRFMLVAKRLWIDRCDVVDNEIDVVVYSAAIHLVIEDYWLDLTTVGTSVSLYEGSVVGDRAWIWCYVVVHRGQGKNSSVEFICRTHSLDIDELKKGPDDIVYLVGPVLLRSWDVASKSGLPTWTTCLYRNIVDRCVYRVVEDDGCPSGKRIVVEYCPPDIRIHSMCVPRKTEARNVVLATGLAPKRIA